MTADRRIDARRRYLTVAEVVADLGVPESTVRYWMATGVLPYLELGQVGKRGRKLIPRDAYEEKLARSTFGGRAG